MAMNGLKLSTVFMFSRYCLNTSNVVAVQLISTSSFKHRSIDVCMIILIISYNFDYSSTKFNWSPSNPFN